MRVKGKKEKKKDKNKKAKAKKERKKIGNPFKVNGKFSFKLLLIHLSIPVVGGFVISKINSNIPEIYEQLNKPIFVPPGVTFPIVWSILYLLMGLASYRIYMLYKQGKETYGGYFYYWLQLLSNYLWIFLFFSFRLYGISFIWLIILFIMIFITFIKFIKADRLSGILIALYMVWVIFAGILNLFIWILNEM